MVLATDDLFFFQRGAGMGNLRRTTIGELGTDMEDDDVFMVQATTGMGNLRRTTWANRNDLANTVMIAVGDASNDNELRRTTWGAINDFLGINFTILAANNNTATNENVTLDELFTAAQLADARNKVITIENGAIVGSTAVDTPAFLVDSDNEINGTITIINGGTIIGHGGDGATTVNTNGGDGGPALRAGVDVTIRNNGTISGGGGGGGHGGTGGNGTSSTTTNRGSTTQTVPFPCTNHQVAANQACVIAFGENTTCNNNPQVDTENCLADCGNCVTTTTTNTTGGTGGDGGNGQGYEQAQSDGSAGGAGGANAGAGGDGGNGGTAGNNGANGEAGANGNSTNGTAGSNGGTAGAAIQRNCATVTIAVEGTINGENVDLCGRATLAAANNNTATNEEVDLDDLFTQAQIESADALEITIENGAIIGSNNTNTPALSISSAFTIGGTVNVINNGTIIGAGGAGGTGNGGNGGNGGVAFSTTVDVRFDNNGTISGGGGGGAAGGNGGNSSTTTENSLGACCCGSRCVEGSPNCCQQTFDNQSAICLTGFTSAGCGSDGNTCADCGTRTTTTTQGGDGGTGGRGQGYNQTSQDGNDGATSAAGDGGDGGNGGAVGANGTNGTAGANGNSTNGTAGGTGGTAGNATTSNGNTILMDNDGTINGTQG
jgi:hypothetical protein